MSNFQKIGPIILEGVGAGFTQSFLVQEQYPHCFVGLCACDAEGGSATYEGFTGIVNVGVETACSPGVIQPVGVIDFANYEELSFAANAVKVHLSSDDGMLLQDYARLIITQNLS